MKTRGTTVAESYDHSICWKLILQKQLKVCKTSKNSIKIKLENMQRDWSDLSQRPFIHEQTTSVQSQQHI